MYINQKYERIAEIEMRLSELESIEFQTNMADILSWQDREKLDSIKRERRELEEELKEIKEENGKK